MPRREDTECGNCDYYNGEVPHECTYYDNLCERITWCEHKTVKGERRSDAHAPLIMKRELALFEAWHQGRAICTHVGFWNEDGPHESECDGVDDEGICHKEKEKHSRFFNW